MGNTIPSNVQITPSQKDHQWDLVVTDEQAKIINENRFNYRTFQIIFENNTRPMLDDDSNTIKRPIDRLIIYHDQKMNEPAAIFNKISGYLQKHLLFTSQYKVKATMLPISVVSCFKYVDPTDSKCDENKCKIWTRFIKGQPVSKCVFMLEFSFGAPGNTIKHFSNIQKMITEHQNKTFKGRETEEEFPLTENEREIRESMDASLKKLIDKQIDRKQRKKEIAERRKKEAKEQAKKQAEEFQRECLQIREEFSKKESQKKSQKKSPERFRLEFKDQIEKTEEYRKQVYSVFDYYSSNDYAKLFKNPSIMPTMKDCEHLVSCFKFYSQELSKFRNNNTFPRVLKELVSKMLEIRCEILEIAICSAPIQLRDIFARNRIKFRLDKFDREIAYFIKSGGELSELELLKQRVMRLEQFNAAFQDQINVLAEMIDKKQDKDENEGHS